jgi:hypothetical protein
MTAVTSQKKCVSFSTFVAIDSVFSLSFLQGSAFPPFEKVKTYPINKDLSINRYGGSSICGLVLKKQFSK